MNESARSESMSRSTAKNAAEIGLFRAMLRWCAATGLVANAPLKVFRNLPEGGAHVRRKRQRLQLESAQALLKASVGSSIEPAVRIVLGTGFRKMEALGLLWTDFDPRAPSLRVRAEVSKNSTARINPIPEGLADYLIRHRTLQEELAESQNQPPSRYIVPGAEPGTHLSGSYAYKALIRAARRAELPLVDEEGRKLDWHALRHSFCTWLIESGALPQSVQALMGHKTLKVTMEVYAELNRAPKVEALRRLPKLDAGGLFGG